MKFTERDFANVNDFEARLSSGAEEYLKMFGQDKSEAWYCVKKFYEYTPAFSKYLTSIEKQDFENLIVADYWDRVGACMDLYRNLALCEDESTKENARRDMEKGAGGWLASACYDNSKLESGSMCRVVAYLLMCDVIRAYE